MEKPVAKATGFFYVRRPGKLANGPLRLFRPGRDADRPSCPAAPLAEPAGNCPGRDDIEYPGPQKTKGPVAGALSGAFGVEVYGFEEGMKKKGSL